MEIALTRGLTAIIDDQDWELVAPYHWHAAPNQNGNFYAAISVPNGRGGRRKLRMLCHRR